MPIRAEPASDMIARTSAKSRLIRPGTVIRSVMPWTPWRRMSSALRKASLIGSRRSTMLSSFSFGTMISVSTSLRSFSMPSRACCMRRRALELERLGDDADGERADLLLGDLSDHRRGAGSGAAALAGGDEDHVGALERLLDVVAALGRGAGADLGLAAGAEAAGQLLADRELDVGFAGAQRLGIRVDGEELDALEPGIDHPGYRVGAAAACADDLDHRQVTGSLHLSFTRLSLFRPELE